MTDELRGWGDNFEDGMRASLVALIRMQQNPDEGMVGPWRIRRRHKWIMRRYGWLFYAMLSHQHANRTWPILDPPRPRGY